MSTTFFIFFLTDLSVSQIILPPLTSFVKKLLKLLTKFVKWLSGEGGIWTLAPLLTTCTLSRGVPSASLGTSPSCSNNSNNIQYIDEWLPCGKVSSAERVGFEPTRPFGQTVFKTASLWPLRYLSMDPPFLARIRFYHWNIRMSTTNSNFFRFFSEPFMIMSQ